MPSVIPQTFQNTGAEPPQVWLPTAKVLCCRSPADFAKFLIQFGISLSTARLALLVEAAALRPLADVTASAEPAPSVAAPSWAGQVLVAQPLPSWPRESYPAPVAVTAPAEDAREAIRTATNAPASAQKVCPNCGTALSLGAYGAAVRWGRCASCKGS
jgi:hypothetical protein